MLIIFKFTDKEIFYFSSFLKLFDLELNLSNNTILVYNIIK